MHVSGSTDQSPHHLALVACRSFAHAAICLLRLADTKASRLAPFKGQDLPVLSGL